jgi:hypothetical protein
MPRLEMDYYLGGVRHSLDGETEMDTNVVVHNGHEADHVKKAHFESNGGVATATGSFANELTICSIATGACSEVKKDFEWLSGPESVVASIIDLRLPKLITHIRKEQLTDPNEYLERLKANEGFLRSESLEFIPDFDKAMEAIGELYRLGQQLGERTKLLDPELVIVWSNQYKAMNNAQRDRTELNLCVDYERGVPKEPYADLIVPMNDIIIGFPPIFHPTKNNS